MITLTKQVNMSFPGRIYFARSPWHVKNFCNIFLPNISENQKKSYYLSEGPWHCPIWKIQRWLLHYVHKKLRWGPEVATFRTKTLDFTRVKLIRKNLIKGMRRSLWSSILFIAKYCCTHVYCSCTFLSFLLIAK